MTTALIDHIVLDDKGIARIAGTRMKVVHLVMDKMANNSTPEEMARAFAPLTLAQVHAALSFYYDHQPELDAQIEESIKIADTMRAEGPAQPTRDALVARMRSKLPGLWRTELTSPVAGETLHRTGEPTR